MRQTALRTSMAVFLFSVMLQASFVLAQDMRILRARPEATLHMLQEKAGAEKRAALTEAGQSRHVMLQDRAQIRERLAELKKQQNRLKAEVSKLKEVAASLEKQEREVSEKLRNKAEMLRELVGVIRINAKDIGSLVSQNLQSALFKPETSFLQDLLRESQFPGMEDVRRMVKLLKDQINQTGWVVVRKGSLVGRDGRMTNGQILLVGPFTAAYRIGDETGFLVYNRSSRQFYALSKLPPSGMETMLRSYMDGKEDLAPVDISRGAAIRELASTQSFLEQIKNGGPVVWPILGVFAAGILIILERTVFLLRRRTDTAKIMHDIEMAVSRGYWERALDACKKTGHQPLSRILLAGLKSRDLGREEMENALQEAILREIPALERFLSALGMLAAIAPLLGLLGTVTGMINTFHVITLHGTGDPRLMSSGISEALVTTMLGLCAAIPLIMGHTLLGGVVDARIAEMEEKAVALVNIVLKSKVEVEEGRDESA